MLTKKQNIQKGREIAYLLRHTLDLIDGKGWANINDLLKVINISRSELQVIIDTNDKKRYEVSINGLKIRALQGHSVDVDVELEEEIPDIELYHGTSSFFIDSIMRDGISSKTRKHVHLSSDIDTALKSGKRHGGEPKLLVLDIKSMIGDGIIFYHSRNDVWLTEYVSTKYIINII